MIADSPTAPPGEPLRLTVRDLMSSRVTAVDPATPIDELRALMRHHHFRHLPVLADDGTVVGLVSYRDLVERRGRLPEPAGEPLVAADVMSSPAQTIGPDTEIRRAAQIMLDRRYGCLPVVEAGRLVGMLTESDFVRRLSQRGR